MTYAERTTFLETIATLAGAKSFWHGKQVQMDINYNAEFPQAHLFDMASQVLDGYLDTQVGMCFYGKDEHENGEGDTITILSEMEALASAFAALLRESTAIELSSGVELRPVLRKGSAIGTGFFVAFRIKHLPPC